MTASPLTADLHKLYPTGSRVQIDGFRHDRGVRALLGASGAGKSTLLRCLAGLEWPEQGRIQFGPETWFDADQRIRQPARRRQVGFVPQDYALFPHLNVHDNLAYGLHRLPSAERRSRIGEAVDWLGLGGLERRWPRELSGGQQQRVALARALVTKPRLLLLDEPFSAVDGPQRQKFRSELRALLAAAETPALVVTHDRHEALALADDLAVLDNGRLVQQGPVREVFARPSSLAVASLVGVDTLVPAQVLQAGGGLVTLRAAGCPSPLHAVAGALPLGVRDVFVAIRAADVMLARDRTTGISARNQLPATVRALAFEDPLVRVELDCGFPLHSLLTRDACADLGLVPGRQLVALVKASHLHVICP